MSDDKPTKKQYAEHKGHTRLGRKPGSVNVKTKLAKLAVAYEDLDPPPPHPKGKVWEEDEAIAEMEFLIRWLSCGDPKKLMPAMCLLDRGYRTSRLYTDLAKKFGGEVMELHEFAKQVMRDKISTLALCKELDSRFAVFTMPNISSWRQQQTVDVATNVSIKTRDYKGIQEVINKRMEDKKKGK